MNSRNVLQTVIGLATVALLLVGCSPQETAPAATSVVEAPTATPTPVPPMATPTPVPPTPTPIPPTPTPTSDPTKSTVQVTIKNPSTVDTEKQVLVLWPIEGDYIKLLDVTFVANMGSEGTTVFRDVPPGKYALAIADTDWIAQLRKGTEISLPMPGGPTHYMLVGDGIDADTSKPINITVVAGKTAIVEGYSYWKK